MRLLNTIFSAIAIYGLRAVDQILVDSIEDRIDVWHGDEQSDNCQQTQVLF